jgi:Flp pilus assembly protein TadB
MAPGVLLAVVAGCGAGAGLVVTAAGFAGHRRPAGTPPPRWLLLLRRWQIGPRATLTALAAGLVMFAVTGWPVAAIAAAPAAIALPKILTRRHERARIALLEALQAWTRRLADVLGASRGLEEALIRSCDSAPPAIAEPARNLARRLRARGTPTQAALQLFGAELDDPAGDLVTSALIQAASRRGPGLRAILTELAASVAKDVTSRREVEAERASYRSALRWVTGFMGGWLIFLLAAKSYSAPFSTPAGQAVLAVAATCFGGGLYWLYRLSQAHGPQRFLVNHGTATKLP